MCPRSVNSGEIMGTSQPVMGGPPPPAPPQQIKKPSRLTQAAANAAARRMAQITAAARQAGVIGPDETLDAFAPLNKSAVTGPGVWMFLQRCSYLLVTKREVILTSWSGVPGPSKKSLHNELRLDRPQDLRLSKPVGRAHLTANSIPLTTAMAAFLGQDVVYVENDRITEQVLRVARTAPAGVQAG